MEPYETAAAAIIDDRRRSLGIALISHRHTVLADRLMRSEVPHRHVCSMGDGAATLDGVRPPILLDTHAMKPPELVDMLCEVSHRRHPLATVVLVHPSDTLALRLAAACPTVPVILAESVSDQVLWAWLRHSTHLSLRASPEIPPALVDVRFPARPIPVNLTTLQILRALRPAYQDAPESMEAVASRSSFSRRMLLYQLAALRSILQIEPERRYRPSDLAKIIFERLSD
jgi:hypothetical protein